MLCSPNWMINKLCKTIPLDYNRVRDVNLFNNTNLYILLHGFLVLVHISMLNSWLRDSCALFENKNQLCKLIQFHLRNYYWVPHLISSGDLILNAQSNFSNENTSEYCAGAMPHWIKCTEETITQAILRNIKSLDLIYNTWFIAIHIILHYTMLLCKTFADCFAQTSIYFKCADTVC